MTQWSTGLFSCFDDTTSCVHGACFGPCLIGKVAQKLGTDSCFMGCCKMYIPIYNFIHFKKQRATIAQQKGYEDEGCKEWGKICFCGPCVVCQHARETGAQLVEMKMGETLENGQKMDRT